MLWLVILIGVAGVSLCAWSMARGGESPFYRILNGLAWLSAAALIGLTLARMCHLASIDWMGGKLAPIVAMSRGYRLYQDPDTGVMTGWIYGPVGALVFYPAAIGKTPTTCGFIGTTIAAICYFVPALWLLWLVAGRRFTPLLAMTLLVFAWAPMVWYDMMSAALLAAPDAPVAGLAACACALLLLPRSTTNLILCATAAVLAVWAKQNYVLLLPGLILWVLLDDGWPGALLFTGITAVIGLAFTTIFVVGFGASNMWFHMFALPASHPFKYANYGPWIEWTMNVKSFFTPLGPSVAFVLLVALLDKLALPADPGAPGLRTWMVQRRWPMLILIALSLLPGGFLGMSKVGGGLNSLALVHGFLILAALAGILSICESVRDHPLLWRKGLQAALAIMSVALAVQGLFDPPTGDVPIWFRLPHPYDNTAEQVFRYAQNHPNQVFCPWNPLVTLLADGKLYHFESGFLDRTSGRQLKSIDQVTAHLPSDFSELIYVDQPQSRMMEQVLVDFRKRVYRPELPDSIVITR